MMCIERVDGRQKRAIHFGAAALLLIVFMLIFGSSRYAWAAEVLVQDEANLLTASEIAELEETCRAFSEESGWDVMALTIADAEGEETGEYADQFFLANNSQDDGVIGVIDMDNRQIYVYTSGNAIDYLTDARIESILDDSFDYVSDGAYSKALTAMVAGARDAYRKGVPAGAYRYDEETGEVTYYDSREPSITAVELMICAAVWIILAAVIFGSTAARYQMKIGKYHYDFRKGSKVKVSGKEDRFVRQMVSRRHIDRTPPSGGGGGGSTVHTGSSGHSYGGGGRSF